MAVSSSRTAPDLAPEHPTDTMPLQQQIPSQPRAYSQAYVPNGAPQPSGPVPGARPLDPNQGRVQQIGHARVLCIADVRGAHAIQSSDEQAVIHSSARRLTARQATCDSSTSSRVVPMRTTSSTQATLASTMTPRWNASLKSTFLATVYEFDPAYQYERCQRDCH